MKTRQLTTPTQFAGALSVLGAGVFWGTSGTAQTFAPTGYDPLVIGLMRISIGGLFLMVLAFARNEIGPLRSWPLRVTCLGAMAVAAFQVCFFSAVHQTGVAVGTVVGVGSAPISAGLLALLVRGERLDGRWIGATLLAIVGCGLLMLSSRWGNLQFELVGLLLALGAGFSYALYALAVKSLIVQKSSLAVMAVLGCLGAIMILPLLWGRDFSWLFQMRGGMVALYMGLFSYALPMFLFARGLRVTPVAVAVTLTLAEPLTASLLGVLVVGERLPPMAWGGLVMVLCGLLLLTVVRGSKGADSPTQISGS